ncbi:hypothetical protein ACE1OC_42735 (plasmid) [Streptomyces sp. DSM 116496]|uniref:hypothetical protein n=1 Tax=Streptomyces stoeckheimensis TaxID=3344656 RepID=UPI0038B2F5FC
MTRTPKQPVWYMATPADGIIERSRRLSPVSLADAVGQVIDHPTPGRRKWFDETPHSYFRMVKSVGEVLEDTGILPTGWPVRLWVVEPLGETGNWGQRHYPYRLLSHQIRVVEETDAWQALGTRGREVLDVIAHQVPALALHWAADWDADPKEVGERRETWRLRGGPDTTSGMKAESLADDAARARRESASPVVDPAPRRRRRRPRPYRYRCQRGRHPLRLQPRHRPRPRSPVPGFLRCVHPRCPARCRPRLPRPGRGRLIRTHRMSFPRGPSPTRHTTGWARAVTSYPLIETDGGSLMHAALPIDLLIGPHKAAEFITACVTELVTEDCIPEPAAYAAVCHAVLTSDPFLLAEAGQVWALRPTTEAAADAPDTPRNSESRPGMLYIVRRMRSDHGRVTVEDEWAERSIISVSQLADYELDQWTWARP